MPESKNPAASQPVTEADLLKSLAALEGKKPEGGDPEPVKKPEFAAPEAGRAADRIREGATEHLRKALDVSSALSEFVNLMGLHVDETLETLTKSIKSGGERDLKIIAVLEGLKKSLDENTEAIKNFGQKPAGAPKSTQASNQQRREPMAKSMATPDGDGRQEAPTLSRREVLTVMETLAKSATRGSAEMKRWTDAAVKFESSGQISNQDLVIVNQERNKQKAA